MEVVELSVSLSEDFPQNQNTTLTQLSRFPRPLISQLDRETRRRRSSLPDPYLSTLRQSFWSALSREIVAAIQIQLNKHNKFR